MNITDEIKQSFKKGSSLTRLIYINLAVFLGINVIYVLFYLFRIDKNAINLIGWIAVPAYLPSLLARPWTVLSYMFVHEQFLHILFNMLWFYWFGKIFLMYLDEKKLLNIYILGGFSGAAFFIAAFNLFPAFQTLLPESMALGASASVIAVVVAVSVYVPDYTVYLLFLGPVKLKYIALFTIFLDVLSIPVGNPGGHIAHLGGAFFGFLFISRLRRGKDITKWFGVFMDRLFSFFKPRKKIKVTYRKPTDDFEYNTVKKIQQETIDKILDKISKGGYESLNKEEKDTLFKMGK